MVNIKKRCVIPSAHQDAKNSNCHIMLIDQQIGTVTVENNLTISYILNT